jgi:hypothetical protein
VRAFVFVVANCGLCGFRGFVFHSVPPVNVYRRGAGGCFAMPIS